MNVYIRIICNTACLETHRQKLASFCQRMGPDNLNEKLPKVYSNDENLMEFSCSFTTSFTSQCISLWFQSFFGTDDCIIFTNEEDMLEMGVFPSVSDMIVDGNKVFVFCYAKQASELKQQSSTLDIFS